MHFPYAEACAAHVDVEWKASLRRGVEAADVAGGFILRVAVLNRGHKV